MKMNIFSSKEELEKKSVTKIWGPEKKSLTQNWDWKRKLIEDIGTGKENTSQK